MAHDHALSQRVDTETAVTAVLYKLALRTGRLPEQEQW